MKTTPKADDDDLFAAIERKHAPISPGEYVGELVFAHPHSTAQTRGAIATVKIREGEWRGREIRLRFVEDGPETIDGIIIRDLSTLRAWWEAVGAEGRPSQRDGFPGVLKTIAKAGRGRRVIFDIGVRTSRIGNENFLIGVRVDETSPF